MIFDGLIVPGLVALAVGAVAARRLPLLGLVVVVTMIAGFALSRYVLGLATPSLVQTILLIALVQAGYLGAVLLSARSGDRQPTGRAAKPVAKTGAKDGWGKDGRAS